jgi:glyoxylase-like metal-dependent hydrolase (beta-lactamase superfamily II)
MNYRIISIGTLSQNEFWGEKAPVRTAHATTTLIRSGERVILVDPGLPGQVIGARLMERAGVKLSDVTDVFLTNFRPAHRRGLDAFEHADWWISEMEREAVGARLVEQLQAAERDKAEELRGLLRQEVAMLRRFKSAPDRLAEQVDVFPLPGFTPGTCGLLLLKLNSTTLIAGDAVPTAEHMEHGQVLKNAYDVEQARESFAEAIEIADVIIPGHDNLLLNPTRRPM